MSTRTAGLWHVGKIALAALQVLVGLNKRNPQIFDMYRVKLETGDLTLDTENPGDVLGWMTDAEFKIRGAISMNPMDGSTQFRTRETVEG